MRRFYWARFWRRGPPRCAGRGSLPRPLREPAGWSRAAKTSRAWAGPRPALAASRRCGRGVARSGSWRATLAPRLMVTPTRPASTGLAPRRRAVRGFRREGACGGPVGAPPGAEGVTGPLWATKTTVYRPAGADGGWCGRDRGPTGLAVGVPLAEEPPFRVIPLGHARGQHAHERRDVPGAGLAVHPRHIGQLVQ